MTPEDRAAKVMGDGRFGAGAMLDVPIRKAIVSEIHAAIEERDREWVKAHHGHCNTKAWADRKLCDPAFHAGFMREKENDAIEDEREACAKVADGSVMPGWLIAKNIRARGEK